MSRTFACPRCATLTTWEDNPSRPFCSDRCKLIDLGAWANDEYRLPTEDAASSQADEE